MRRITILISPQGETQIESHGFAGGECRLATQFLRQALGQDLSEQLKPEYLQVTMPVPIRQSAAGEIKMQR